MAAELRLVSELPPGETCTVARIQGPRAIRQRLLDMGIVPSVTIEIERVAPAGDPVWIRLHGYQLSLRRSEASAILAV